MILTEIPEIVETVGTSIPWASKGKKRRKTPEITIVKIPLTMELKSRFFMFCTPTYRNLFLEGKYTLTPTLSHRREREN
jgi:hypothetical protein